MSGAAKTFMVLVFGTLAGQYAWHFHLKDQVPGFFPTKELEQQFVSSFQSVSPDWDAWAKKHKQSVASARRKWKGAWRDSISMANRRLSARAAVEYGTRDEVLELYRWRSQVFARAAPDARLNGICGGGRPDLKALAGAIDMQPIARMSGRAMGRLHKGEEPWVPPVDLENDQSAWTAFGTYLRSKQMGLTLSVLAQDQRRSGSDVCRGLAGLYGAAASRPEDRVGQHSLLDFVRSLDLIASQ